MPSSQIICDDVIRGLRTLPSGSVHCCVTSPPYWGLRDYGHDGQIGLESTPEAYVARMVEVFREVRRVLRDDGTLWLNLGDSYNNAGSSKNGTGLDGKMRGGATGADGECGYKKRDLRHALKGSGIKHKDLVGIPWRVAFALQTDGWWLRQDIIWHKPNPMPESVRDRCTKAHEYLFLLTKSQRYYYDAEAVKEAAVTGAWDAMPPIGGVKHAENAFHGGGVYTGKQPANGGTRNRRSVWTITTKPYKGAHFAVMPPDLVEPCVLAGTSERGCCPECGAPWERVVERDRRPTRPGTESKVYAKSPVADGSPYLTHSGDICGNRDPQRHVTVSCTTGWRPTCTCGESIDPVPCTVLDPFAGSGTTLAVALRNHRSTIGCELNPEYAALALDRIAKEREKAGLFA